MGFGLHINTTVHLCMSTCHNSSDRLKLTLTVCTVTASSRCNQSKSWQYIILWLRCDLDTCPLARDNEAAAELEQTMGDSLDTIKCHPIFVGQVVVDRKSLRGRVS